MGSGVARGAGVGNSRRPDLRDRQELGAGGVMGGVGEFSAADRAAASALYIFLNQSKVTYPHSPPPPVSPDQRRDPPRCVAWRPLAL